MKRVGLPWNSSQSNSETYTRIARITAPKLGIDLIEDTVDTTAAVGEVVASLVGRGAEAILTTGDMTVSPAIDTVVAEAGKGGVPVFSTQPDTATRGVLLALGGDYYQIGRETGDLAARVLSGEDMSQIPVQYTLPMKPTMNRNAAARLKGTWVFPRDLLAKAREVSGSSLPDAPIPLPNK